MAANAYINIYTNNPTAGDTDGTAVSTGGEFTAPIVVDLNASASEVKKVKLAVRCETGYETSADVVISVVAADANSTAGATTDKWGLSLTENGTFASTLTITSTVDDSNTVFWAQVSSANGEEPVLDTSVALQLSTSITTVQS